MSVKPQWTLITPLRKFLLRMYAQAGYEPGPAADYVEALACRKKWTTRARDDIEKFIGDELLRATDDEIAGAVMPEGTAYVSAALRAQKILRAAPRPLGAPHESTARRGAHYEHGARRC
jgi:hypothetical protein